MPIVKTNASMEIISRDVENKTADSFTLRVISYNCQVYHSHSLDSGSLRSNKFNINRGGWFPALQSIHYCIFLVMKS